MKSRKRMCIQAIALFAMLAIPVRLPAQGNPDRNNQHHHYTLIDMGTFGGPNSSQTSGGPGELNQRGVTVGWSATSVSTSPTSNPLVCGGLDGTVPFITVAFEWKDGTLTDLGALPGGSNCSEPFWLNENGEIVGTSENGEVDPLAGVNQTRAVLWKEGKITDLGSFGGYQNAAQAINNRGQIVGWSLNTIPDPYSLNEFVFFGSSNGTQTRAFLLQHGVMQDLGTLLTGNDAAAFDINERGQVAGYGYTSSIPNPVTGIPPIDPFLWEKGNMTDIGGFGGALGLPSSLNNRGQVIGLSSVAANPAACFTEQDPDCHPFLWSQGKLTDLKTSTTGGKPITPDGITDAGEIVGAADFSSNGGSAFDAYLWKSGAATDLGHLQGDCFSRAISRNSVGEIVGNSFSCDGSFHHAFLWANGSIIDLNTLIPANAPLQLVDMSFINDLGEIAGNGVPPGVDPSNVMTQGHAFLLLPCDENHPGVEGCDYSLVEAPPAPQVSPLSRDVFSGTQRVSPPSRINRLHIPGFATGPTN
jgi:probable HAF family extracellular repeat protein